MMANCYFVIEFVSYGLLDVRLEGKMIYLGILTLIILINYIYFKRKGNYKTVIKKGEETAKKVKVYRDVLCVSYIIASFLFMGFMVYLKHNNIGIF